MSILCVCYSVCVYVGHAGVTALPTIQQNVREAIDGKMSLFCLGFGNDVDYSFLDVMAQENKGVARRIYEASDATAQLQVQYKTGFMLGHIGLWDITF